MKILKTKLGAIGFAADTWGIALFRDSLDTIRGALDKHPYSLECIGEHWRLTGPVTYRSTPYRHLLELLIIHGGAQGATSAVKENTIHAWPLSSPADEIQQAFHHILHPEHPVQRQPWATQLAFDYGG